MTSNSLLTTPLPVPETARQRGGPLLAAAAAHGVALGLTYLVFVSTSGGQELEGALLPRAEQGGGYEQQTDLVVPAKEVLATFGDPTLLVLLLAGVFVVGALGRRLRAGIAGVGIVLATVAATSALKDVLVRPELGVVGSSSHNSFPSGHVGVAMGLLLAFLLVLPDRARPWLAVPGAVGVAVVASSTMVVGWHRLSDTVGGVLVAAALYFVATAVLARGDGTAAARPSGLTCVPVAVVLLVVVAVSGVGLTAAIVAATAFTALVVAACVLVVPQNLR